MTTIGAGRGALTRKKTAAAAGLQEQSSVAFEEINLVTTWDETITISAGSNRVLLVYYQSSNPGTVSCVLDPAGDNIALTAVTGSPATFLTTQEHVFCFRLLEANFPGTTGSKTIRFTSTNTTRGHGRAIQLSGARQTLSSAGAAVDDVQTVVPSTTRSGGGNFPSGTKVYAAMNGEGTGGVETYTVTGDVVEVQDVLAANNDCWVFATGTLGTSPASVSATFSRDVGTTFRKQAIIVAVEAF